MKNKICIIFLMISAISFVAYSQGNSNSKEELWGKISPYFSVPSEFSGQYGNYKSLLKFYNGDTVLTKNDWRKRRNEIYTKWNDMMGKWPNLIQKQKMKILDTEQKEGYTKYRISFKWTPTEETEAYLLVPKLNKKKYPAVVTTFYEPKTAIGEGKPNRDFALQLVKRGFVALSIGTTKASQDRTYSLYYPSIQNAKVQPLSMLAYAAANSWYLLSDLPYVDNKRIGIMGHSFGGKWAMFGSCLFDKFACAVWSDPGVVFDEDKGSLVNYWEPWYLGYYPTPWENVWRKKGNIEGAKGLYPRLLKENHDLHEIMALMAPRPFLVSGGASDQPVRWTALNHVTKINKLLGVENRVAMQNRVLHEPNNYSNSIAYDFFEYFLK
ncbi:alpha/beta hydrolase family protein [Pseudopedobacter beijingensis]|uniref:Alpha/beta hydrolase family protein n=1 Tax=Pseudopedobacter beijingensis TaxID=1207056 RepID=A0ABW4IJ07_9SPHI